MRPENETQGPGDNERLEAELYAPEFEPGGIVFDLPAMPDALWGLEMEVLSAMGEPTVIASAIGIGKTTLAQRVGLAAIGIGPSEVLGYPVKQIEGRVLYIAADRPAQALRSLRRMVKPEDRPILDERFRWERLRRINITPDDPHAIHRAAKTVGAGLVIIDSVKDVVAATSSEEGGQAFNNAVQICVANGVEVIALHHLRKATSEGRTKIKLDDIYGSTWLVAGAGSVIVLNGVDGEAVASLQHLKMPAEEVGPFDIDFDYEAGTVTTIGRRDILAYIDQQGTATTAQVSSYVLDKDKVTGAENKRIERKLDRLATRGQISKLGGGKGHTVIWRAIRAGEGTLHPVQGERHEKDTGKDTEKDTERHAPAEGPETHTQQRFQGRTLGRTQKDTRRTLPLFLQRGSVLLRLLIRKRRTIRPPRLHPCPTPTREEMMTTTNAEGPTPLNRAQLGRE